MKTITRRKFLKSILCGVGLTLVGTASNSLFARPLTKENPEVSPDKRLLEQFDEARTLFSKKQFAEAEQLYKHMLAGLPAHISIYDCYKNLLARENRTDEIIPYYKNAIEKFPARADFYDRLAKIYREIATGNKKIEKRVCEAENETNLIEAASRWYDRGIAQNPHKKFLYFGLLDTLYARSGKKGKPKNKKGRTVIDANDLPDMDEREQQLTEPYIQEWLRRKNPETAVNKSKARIAASVPVQIRTQIEKIKTRKRKPLFYPADIESRAREMKLAIKKLDMNLHSYYCTQNDLLAMTTLTKEILRENPDETQILGKARKMLKKAGRWDLQVDIYNDRYQSFNDFFTHEGLSYANLRKKDISRALQLYNILSTKTTLLSAVKTDMVYRGLCECYVAWKNYAEGKRQLLTALRKINGIGGIATSLLIRYAELTYLEGNPQTAIELLRIKLNPDYHTRLQDSVLTYIAPDLSSSPALFYLHQTYRESKTIHKEEKVSILCAIAKIQEKENNRNEFNATIREINKLIPSYPFIKKHQI